MSGEHSDRVKTNPERLDLKAWSCMRCGVPQASDRVPWTVSRSSSPVITPLCMRCFNQVMDEQRVDPQGLWTVKQADQVAHPSHYADTVPGIECIDVVQHFNFNRGNVIKYVWRAGAKGDEVEDLRKARQYIDFEIARLEAK